jgi:hypothetical protein
MRGQNVGLLSGIYGAEIAAWQRTGVYLPKIPKMIHRTARGQLVGLPPFNAGIFPGLKSRCMKYVVALFFFVADRITKKTAHRKGHGLYAYEEKGQDDQLFITSST